MIHWACILLHFRVHFWWDPTTEGGGGWGEGGGDAGVWRRSNTRTECLMWQLEIVRMRGDTELWLPQPRPVIQSDCQSVTLGESSPVYSLCVCVCVCPCLSSGDRSGRSDSVAWPSVSRPVKWRACQLSWQTLSSCWPTTAAANVGHVLWQSDTAYTTTRRADRTRAVKFDMRGSPLRARALGGWVKAAVIPAQLETRRPHDTSLTDFCS